MATRVKRWCDLESWLELKGGTDIQRKQLRACLELRPDDPPYEAELTPDGTFTMVVADSLLETRQVRIAPDGVVSVWDGCEGVWMTLGCDA